MYDAGRWQRLKDVFEQALERPPEERHAFLAEACGDDLELKDEVESLLRAQKDVGHFLSQPMLPASGAPDMEGRRIGPYRVAGKVGHGGMGVVYRAVRDDDVFQKTVALKLVHGGASDEHLRRLGQERQILARLQHPNIAAILDGGTTEEGQPYLVMEYVEGEPIDTYCNTRDLGRRERLELFRMVCGAVHYAHQNLVVHRDLKPQNILVTAEGQPKLLDFGIAKLLAAGVDPSRRYLSAQQFAEDIRLHLAGLPVLARKDTLGYRVGKFVGRHRAGMAAAVLVLASLLGGLVTTVRQARIAEANRIRAERRFADVRQLANSFLFEFHDAIKELPGSTAARKLVVGKALEYLDRLQRDQTADPGLKFELATAYKVRWAASRDIPTSPISEIHGALW